jgi:hypothetical protein
VRKFPVYPRPPERAIVYSLVFGGVVAAVSAQDGLAQALVTGFIVTVLTLAVYLWVWSRAKR